MTEREAFVMWLEPLDPKLPTTHDVEVAWRAWQARSIKDIRKSQVDAYKAARETQYARLTEMRDAINEAIRAMTIARIEKTEIYGPSFETGKILSAAIQLASDALAHQH